MRALLAAGAADCAIGAVELLLRSLPALILTNFAKGLMRTDFRCGIRLAPKPVMRRDTGNNRLEFKDNHGQHAPG